MSQQKAENPVLPFEEIWEEHRAYLRRLLLARTRDAEIADDLLQETYLRAHAGMAGYRQGDMRAWLSAIAKNVWFAHCRESRRYCELPDEEVCAGEEVHAGSPRHLMLLAIRQAMARLSPKCREALLLRHFGDLSYHDIAECCGCPESTARCRVWDAVQQLKLALGVTKEEVLHMSNHRFYREVVLDSLHASLTPEETSRLQAHLHECPTCREQAREIKELIVTLDADKVQFGMMHYYELDTLGEPTYYCWCHTINN